MLSRELSEFLIEFSIAAHRFAMYPPGHPSLGSAAENVVGRLAEIFEGRRSLTIGVAQRQLVIENVATDSRHPVVAELARRLHEHQLGAMSFSKGTNVREIEGVLRLLARDTDDEPAGLLPVDRLPTWEHARLYPLGYDQLVVKAEGATDLPEPDRVVQLWLELAQAAMGRGEDVDGSAVPGPNTLARIIEKHQKDSAYDEVIAGYLKQLADELQSGGGEESEKVARHVSTLISELADETLTRLVKLGGSAARQRRFVLDANQTLAVDAVIKVVRAAAEANARNVSDSMTRLLSKLAAHAERGNDRVRGQADTALREHVEELMANWDPNDPNPSQYRAMLDVMAHSSPLFEARLDRGGGGETAGARRVIEMALEVDAWGPSVEAAVESQIATGDGPAVLRLADAAAADNRTAIQVRRHLMSPTQLKKALAGSDVDEASLGALVQRMGSEAIPPLLDVLADSSSRAVRRKVFDQLARMGPEVGERAVERMSDRRWFVLRNMLVLLQRLERLPAAFDAGQLLAHPDERVRREALPLALRNPQGRERVLASALAARDERTVRMALLELRKELPETLVPAVVSRVVQSDWAPEIRALGARALGKSRSPLALDALLGLSTGGKSRFGRKLLASKGPDVLAALRTLATVWSGDDRARDVLALAAASKDPEIRQAVEAIGE